MINYKNKLKGFTIIELIVVIAIIAVLATVVVSYVNDYNRKAKIAATQTQLGEIAKAVLLYKAQYGCYPSYTNCSGTTCDCLEDVEQPAFVTPSKSVGFNLNNIFKKIINIITPSVSASETTCSQEGEYFVCSGGYCVCSAEGEEDTGCSEIGNICEGSSSIGNASDIITVLVNNKFLGSGNLISADAWNHPYYVAFNVGINNECSFIYSFGPDGVLNTNGSTCADYFSGDDIYILIEGNE